MSISFSLQDYLILVDESWLKLRTNFESIFIGAECSVEYLCEFSEHAGLQRAYGITS
jgi:hypothetical protein